MKSTDDEMTVLMNWKIRSDTFIFPDEFNKRRDGAVITARMAETSAPRSPSC